MLFHWLKLGKYLSLSKHEVGKNEKKEKKHNTFLLVYVFKSFITVYRKTSDSEPTVKDSKHTHKILTERCMHTCMYTDTHMQPYRANRK